MKVAKHKWVVLEDKDSVHVLPEEDIKPHGFPDKEGTRADLANIDCPCKPKLDFSGRKPVVVHNSFEQDKILDEIISDFKEKADNNNLTNI